MRNFENLPSARVLPMVRERRRCSRLADAGRMSRFVQSLLLAWLVWVHASHGAADPGLPEAYADRWVVVVGNSPSARAAKVAAARRGVHVLPSDRFSGLSPVYYVLAEGPFEAWKDAQRLAAELVHKGRPAYVKFTGAWRAEAPADPQKAGTSSPPEAGTNSPEPASPGSNLLSEAQRAALERRRQRWRCKGRTYADCSR